MSVPKFSDIMRHRPFESLTPRRTYIQPVEQIDPLIRIAHRVNDLFNIRERIIFDHEFVLNVSGHGVLSTPDGPLPYTPGTLMFIRPFWPHAFDSGDTPCEHLAVHFDFQPNLPPQSKDPQKRSSYEVRLTGGLQIPAVHQGKPNDAVHKIFSSLVRAGTDAGPVDRVEQRGCLMQMIAVLLQSTATPLADDSEDARAVARIDRAIAHIAQHFATPLTADDLAEIAGLSPSHFTRLFRNHTGYTPMQYLRHQRIKAARMLLAEVDLSIKEIAARCGFDDQYRFSKVFHQIDGLSPSVYRDALLAGRKGR